jgi:antitoxin component of MazEF toxin-antitoxin module
MALFATLRRIGGSITLRIPKAVAQALAVDAGSVVELEVQGRSLSLTPARKRLADRLAVSPKSPAQWSRGPSLDEGPVGRELL